jgi:hypothetical protein
MPQFIPPPLNPDPEEEPWVAPDSATRAELYEFETKRLIVNPERLAKMARDGTITPDSTRRMYWMLLLDVVPRARSERDAAAARMLKEYNGLVDELLKDVTESPLPLSDDPRRIDVDIPRTLPVLHFYASHEAVEHRPIPSESSSSAGPAEPVSTNSGAQEGEPPTDGASHDSLTGKSARPKPPAPRPVPFTTTAVSPFTPNQLALRRVLHLFARLNAGAGYVQGMNEIVGHFLYAYCSGKGTATPQHEAEVFFSFQHLHQYVGDNFQREMDLDANGVKGTLLAYTILLARCDREVYEHMEDLALVPEYYAFRWITLMFSQDFHTPEVLSLWDFLLSFQEDIDAAVIFTAVAMATLVRERLLDAGFATAIQLLQNYPHDEIELRTIKAQAVKLIEEHGFDAARDGRGGSKPVTPSHSASASGNNSRSASPATEPANAGIKGWVTGLMGRLKR